jgi:hypothetical protein
MIRPTFAKFMLGFCLFSGTSFVAGCSSEPAPQDEAAVAGTLSMPLLASTGSHTYRLQGYAYVNGPSFQYLDLNADVITTQLPTGDYQAYLYSWELLREDGSGNFQPVAATLVSSYAPAFTIFNGATSTISFQFETDGLLVTVGAGALNVKLEVSETAPPCTPLGSDCAEGAWCPPPELTGTPASCVAAGPLAEGDACSSPLDCPANTSCFDFGAGPACVALCDGSSVGLPCGASGTCTAQGADYGVCVAAP